MTADWHEQAYEDQYWSERVAVSTWDKTTAAMFLDAVAMSTAHRSWTSRLPRIVASCTANERAGGDE